MQYDNNITNDYYLQFLDNITGTSEPSSWCSRSSVIKNRKWAISVTEGGSSSNCGYSDWCCSYTEQYNWQCSSCCTIPRHYIPPNFSANCKQAEYSVHWPTTRHPKKICSGDALLYLLQDSQCYCRHLLVCDFVSCGMMLSVSQYIYVQSLYFIYYFKRL